MTIEEAVANSLDQMKPKPSPSRDRQLGDCPSFVDSLRGTSECDADRTPCVIEFTSIQGDYRE